ncbi:hypothetical protein CERSUDRAFT_116871 [Gelatoporia subvermispora B]|uniref:F-box domain-containing protein n=1 Tax=Ceriporiopsis subvermispora (strain B) TaxID=914234 RepID=M2R8A7_CERS8|nr:hypothetical protein CERSUDRAFT_116871 [Gelatoporia subvermispora B]
MLPPTRRHLFCRISLNSPELCKTFTDLLDTSAKASTRVAYYVRHLSLFQVNTMPSVEGVLMRLPPLPNITSLSMTDYSTLETHSLTEHTRYRLYEVLGNIERLSLHGISFIDTNDLGALLSGFPRLHSLDLQALYIHAPDRHQTAVHSKPVPALEITELYMSFCPPAAIQYLLHVVCGPKLRTLSCEGQLTPQSEWDSLQNALLKSGSCLEVLKIFIDPVSGVPTPLLDCLSNDRLREIQFFIRRADQTRISPLMTRLRPHDLKSLHLRFNAAWGPDNVTLLLDDREMTDHILANLVQNMKNLVLILDIEVWEGTFHWTRTITWNGAWERVNRALDMWFPQLRQEAPSGRLLLSCVLGLQSRAL